MHNHFPFIVHFCIDFTRASSPMRDYGTERFFAILVSIDRNYIDPIREPIPLDHDYEVFEARVRPHQDEILSLIDPRLGCSMPSFLD